MEGGYQFAGGAFTDFGCTLWHNKFYGLCTWSSYFSQFQLFFVHVWRGDMANHIGLIYWFVYCYLVNSLCHQLLKETCSTGLIKNNIGKPV